MPRCETRLNPPIFIIDLEEDDPAKCTAKKMVRHGFACRVSKPPRRALLLDPYTPTPLSPIDAPNARHGITVVDASWNRLDERRYHRVTRGARLRRRLPLLFAANPPHYGRAFQLSSLEAAAAALYITGFREHAAQLLSLYKWGQSFLELNAELLEAYASAESPEHIVEIEAGVLSRILSRPVDAQEATLLIRKLATQA